MQIKAEVVKTTTVKFELTHKEWLMLAELVTNGRAQLNNSNNPLDLFGYHFLNDVNDVLSDEC